MAEYIERNKVITIVKDVMHNYNCAEDYGCDKTTDALLTVLDSLNNRHVLPTADVQRHGKWIAYKHYTNAVQCTSCKHVFDRTIYGYAYCPLCGARMDGKDGENNDKD